MWTFLQIVGALLLIGGVAFISIPAAVATFGLIVGLVGLVGEG